MFTIERNGFVIVSCCLIVLNTYVLAYPTFDINASKIRIALRDQQPAISDCQHHISKRTASSLDIDVPFDDVQPVDELLELAEINVFRPVFRYRVATAYARQLQRSQQFG